ncbi:MAG: hypothetical protein OJF52_004170 [Nitrospira sp.]|nr:MAG: hypothetical protein OJF52_004170 [Nitrospira sp.]
MSGNEKQRMHRGGRARQVILLALIWGALVSPMAGERESLARSRDLVATPPLMGSPLQVIESQMRSGEIQRFESRMLDSPLQLIGSPFGPFRFATLPNFQDLWATRQSISMLPAMLQTPRGILLLLPYYVLPLAQEYLAGQSETVAEDLPASQPQSVAQPKFFSARCGTFMEILVPPNGHLSDEENKPC